jgi:hypothetical protein
LGKLAVSSGGETAVLGEIHAFADFRLPIGNWQLAIVNVKKLVAATDPVRRAREAMWPLRRAIPIHKPRAATVSSKIRDLLNRSFKTTGSD